MNKITSLTDAQKARFPEWVEKWTCIGLCTEPADRPKFEHAVKICYQKADLQPPKSIVWVDSPLVLALAAPIAAFIIENIKQVKEPDAVRGAVSGAVGDAVGVAVHDAVHVAVDGAVGVAVGGAVDGAVRGAVGDAVGVAVGGAVSGAVHNAVDGAVSVAVGGAVDGAVRGAVGDAVGVAVHDAVHVAVRGAVSGAVDGAVRGAVGNALKAFIEINYSKYIGGQFWVGGWYLGAPSYISFFEEVCGLQLSPDVAERTHAYQDTAMSASWWWPHTDFVMACERPRAINRDQNGRLHSAIGRAFEARDGWGFYCWHGVRVPAQLIEHPESITLENINSEKNAEIKRIMLERYGLERYITDSGMRVAHEDQSGKLFILPGAQFPVVLVRNSTPEPDGTVKNYVLTATRRDVKTAHEAVASTFGLRADQYNPAHES